MFLFPQGVFASGIDVYPDEPAHLYKATDIFANVLIAAWSLSILYFIVLIISIGAEWMLSGGDEQKLTALKGRGGRILVAIALIFGGYIFTRTAMSFIALRNPNDCFKTPLAGTAVPGKPFFEPFFQFFFPKACTGEKIP